MVLLFPTQMHFGDNSSSQKFTSTMEIVAYSNEMELRFGGIQLCKPYFCSLKLFFHTFLFAVEHLGLIRTCLNHIFLTSLLWKGISI